MKEEKAKGVGRHGDKAQEKGKRIDLFDFETKNRIRI